MLRPIGEAACAVVLLLILIGNLTGLAGSKTKSYFWLGALLSAIIALIGFQAVRSSNGKLLMIYSLLTVALLLCGFFGFLEGVMTYAVLHGMGIALGIYNANSLKAKAFVV